MVDYCESLLTPQMEVSNSPEGLKSMRKKYFKQFYLLGIFFTSKEFIKHLLNYKN